MNTSTTLNRPAAILNTVSFAGIVASATAQVKTWVNEYSARLSAAVAEAELRQLAGNDERILEEIRAARDRQFAQ